MGSSFGFLVEVERHPLSSILIGGYHWSSDKIKPCGFIKPTDWSEGDGFRAPVIPAKNKISSLALTENHWLLMNVLL